MSYNASTAASPPALQLWHAYPRDLHEDSIALACTAILSEDERIRAERFRFDRHRREYLATHALARTALAHNHPLPPAAWRFLANAHGKPAADPDCGLRFNLSNAADLVVCLIARGSEVGVDVEPLARAAEIVDLAPHVFSPAEQAQLAGLSATERLERGVSLWVLKEAYMKARGLGLSIPLKGFSFLFDAGERIHLVIETGSHPTLDDTPSRWRFCLLDQSAHRIAVMVETAPGAAAPAIERWEARPPLCPARLFSEAVPEWFPRE